LKAGRTSQASFKLFGVEYRTFKRFSGHSMIGV
jgi:hypothetical protein